MNKEVEEYFFQQYKKAKFRVVPGHWPNFKTKGEVDQWLEKMEHIMEIVFQDSNTKMDFTKFGFNGF